MKRMTVRTAKQAAERKKNKVMRKQIMIFFFEMNMAIRNFAVRK